MPAIAALTFKKYERIIQVDADQTSLDIQDLLNQIRLYEEQLINLDYGTIANAYGKQPLGGGTYIGITLELINNWRLAFEARPPSTYILCTVSGGNLVAINDYENNPIYPTAFTQVVIAQSSSPTIIQAPSDYAALYMLESLRGKNRSLGNIWYWNPTSGNDSNNGTTPATAVQTFAQAQTLSANAGGVGDIIFALATAGAGVTVTTPLNITVPNLKIRGPGYLFKLAGTVGSPTVTVSADNVELSGFYVTTQATGSDNAVTIIGDNANIENCWISNVRGSGISIAGSLETASARTRIEKSVIENCGNASGNGITIGDYTTQTMIDTCIISDSPNGVSISGSNSADNILENNLIYNHAGYGITIAAGPLRTHVRRGHTFSKNTSGDTNYPAGYDTFVETQAGGLNETQVANAVWNAAISGYTGAGTTGKTLKDAKTKATLASLK
ncbi:right-handed parallel beta-helix repeat-containing protein [Candidatus Roizmanbacteria bacterium]|nr:right-handed parallel beta-helix repeat-containing protein [Candidatus Roizmanbacteria bacterium]